MRTVSAAKDLAEYAGGVFVPTMGALHAGHISLIEYAAAVADGRAVVVSIFVNPTQFAPGEDYESYPRTLEADLEAARRAGAAVVFTPSVETMYPEGMPTVFEPLPRVAHVPRLEDRFRPHFFHGVCTVVKRLFELVQPAEAIFGEKDYQQLLVIREMVHLLKMDIKITGRPTVREADGLALSSRNAYLEAEERENALGLYLALLAAREVSQPREAEELMGKILAEHGLKTDYAVVRDADTLLPVEAGTGAPRRGLIAARLGKVRLIDNMALGTSLT